MIDELFMRVNVMISRLVMIQVLSIRMPSLVKFKLLLSARLIDSNLNISRKLNSRAWLPMASIDQTPCNII